LAFRVDGAHQRNATAGSVGRGAIRAALASSTAAASAFEHEQRGADLELDRGTSVAGLNLQGVVTVAWYGHEDSAPTRSVGSAEKLRLMSNVAESVSQSGLSNGR
jgi:hypothetical protein